MHATVLEVHGQQRHVPDQPNLWSSRRLCGGAGFRLAGMQGGPLLIAKGRSSRLVARLVQSSRCTGSRLAAM